MISCLLSWKSCAKITRAGQNRATRWMRNMKKMKNTSITSVNRKHENILFYRFLVLSRVTLHIHLSQVAPEAGLANWRLLPAMLQSMGPTWHGPMQEYTVGRFCQVSSFHKVQQQVPHLSSVQWYPVAFYIYGFHSWFLILYSGKNVVGAGLCLCIKICCKHITLF